MPLSRVLLTEVGHLRPARIGETRLMIRDASAVEFQVEELIAIGASEVAVEATWLPDILCEMLPPTLRDRVVSVDEKRTAHEKYLAIAVPIAEEVGIVLDRFPSCISWRNEPPTEVVRDASIYFLFELPKFILGIQEKLCIDLNVVALRQTAEILRSVIRPPNIRANLAIISGALCAYKDVAVDCVEFIPESPERRLALFKDFIDDESYRMLSAETYELGIPRRINRAMKLISRHVRDLLQKPFAVKAAKISTRAIATATQVPVLDSDVLDLLNRGDYFPPIVHTKRSIVRAYVKWRSQKPPLLPFPSPYWAIQDISPDD